MRPVSGHERRARLAVRRALAPAFRVGSPESATRAMTVLHTTEPAVVYPFCWARVGSLELTDVDRPGGRIGQVRVRVKTAGVQPFDVAVVAGIFLRQAAGVPTCLAMS